MAFSRTTAANTSPTAASGSVTFAVADVSKLPAVPFYAKVFPQQRGVYDPDDGTLTGAQEIYVTASTGSGPGGTITATLGVNSTTAQAVKFGYYILAIGLLGPFNETVTVAAQVAATEVNAWGITSTPDATAGGVTAFSLSLVSNPTGNYVGPANGLQVFVTHSAGNFTQTTVRAIGGTVSQTAAGTIGEARAIEGVVAVSAGTITTGIGVDSTWSMSGGAMTSWVAFRSRQGSGTFPGTEYGAILYGHNLFEKGLSLGEINTAATNISLRLKQAITVSAAAGVGIQNITAFTAAANSDAIYGMTVLNSVVKGAFTGLSYYGVAYFAPTASGAGTIATAAQIYLELPTLATNNYMIHSASALSAAPAGAVQGSIKIKSPSGDGYIEVKALS